MRDQGIRCTPCARGNHDNCTDRASCGLCDCWCRPGGMSIESWGDAGTSADLYDVARQVTDEVLGEGTYAEINRGNPDPGVQRTIWRARVTEPTLQVIVDQLAAIEERTFARKGDKESDWECALCGGSSGCSVWDPTRWPMKHTDTCPWHLARILKEQHE